MAEKPIKYRELRRILKTFNIKEEKRRGKGSERMFVGLVDSRTITYPVKCHNEGEDKPKAVVAAVRRAFALTKKDGIEDRDFYRRSKGKKGR